MFWRSPRRHYGRSSCVLVACRCYQAPRLDKSSIPQVSCCWFLAAGCWLLAASCYGSWAASGEQDGRDGRRRSTAMKTTPCWGEPPQNLLSIVFSFFCSRYNIFVETTQARLRKHLTRCTRSTTWRRHYFLVALAQLHANGRMFYSWLRPCLEKAQLGKSQMALSCTTIIPAQDRRHGCKVWPVRNDVIPPRCHCRWRQSRNR